MPHRVRRLVAAAGLLGASAGGCPRIGPYVCATDADCDRPSSGVCLSDGACAYPVSIETCPSGLARSSEAQELAGRCVPPGGGPGSTSGDAPSPEEDSRGDTGSMCWSSEFRLALDVLATESLAGYPLRVRLSNPSLVAAARGHRLEAFDEASVALPVEHAPTSDPERVELWLRLPESATGVIPIRVLGRPEDGLPRDTSAVWAEYRSVWHLDDPIPASAEAEFNNRVERTESLRAVVTLDPQQSVPAVLDRGVSLDGIDDALTAITGYWGELRSFSVSLWARFDGTDVPDDDDEVWHLITGINGDGIYPHCNRRNGGQIDCLYRLVRESDPEQTALVGFFEGFSEAPGVWFHVGFSRDAATGTVNLLVNGVHQAKTEPTTPDDFVLDGGETPLSIGRAFGTRFSRISVDEVRITDRALPVAWLRADAISQRDPALAVVDDDAEIVPIACPP